MRVAKVSTSKEVKIIKEELVKVIKRVKMTMAARMTKCILSKRIKVCALSTFNHVTIDGNSNIIIMFTCERGFKRILIKKK